MADFTNNRLFPFRLWLLTTVFVGTIVLGLGSALYNSNYLNSANFGVILLFVPFGMVFSLPTFMVVWLTHSSVGETLSPVLMKWLLVCIAVIGVFVTFSLVGGSMAKAYSLFYAAAVVGLILQGWKS